MQQDEARLKSLARQYNWLRERGESHEQALTNLSQNAGAALQPVLNRLAIAQQNIAQSDPFIADRLGGLSRVLDRTEANATQRSALLLGALAFSDQLNDIGKDIREKFMARYSYMIVLCLVGLLVSTLYVVYVYPQMWGLGTLLVSSLPKEQSLFYDLGLLGYPLIFLVMLVLTSLMCFFSIKSSYELGAGKNFAAPMHFMPGLPGLNEALKAFLYIGLQRLYARSGFDASSSAKFAGSYTDTGNEELEEAIHVAWKLNTLENEFIYQQKHTMANVENATDRASSLWYRMLAVITAIILILMITDYYRPIFRMGAI